MTNELEELRQANRVDRQALANAVALDRQDLMSLLDSERSANRTRYVGAIVAAAAAVLVGVFVIQGEEVSPNVNTVEVADETVDQVLDGTMPDLVITGVDSTSESTSTTANPMATSTSTSISTSTSATATSTSTSAVTSTPISTPVQVVEGPFDVSVDLMVLHYDHAHLDDGHATVAALELATTFGFQPLVVAGTYPNSHDGYVHNFEPVMQAAWGDTWLNAHVDRVGAVDSSVQSWLATLDDGGRVWVAEGGVSDFTTDVVREILKRRPGIDSRSAIRVVQHNGRNESETVSENLTFLKANTSYERIDDGNSANGTADLYMQSSEFEASALAGQHGQSWVVAFEYLSPDELDFSDTVEVLHILGVGLDEVADPTDFAARFIN